MNRLILQLPAVDELLRQPDLAALVASEGQTTVTDATRNVLNPPACGNCGRAIGCGRGRPRTVWNLRGLLHARFGSRSLTRCDLSSTRPESSCIPISDALRWRLPLWTTFATIRGIFEPGIHVVTGERGKRDIHVDRLFRRLLHEGRAGEAPAPHRIFPLSSSTTMPRRCCWR